MAAQRLALIVFIVGNIATALSPTYLLALLARILTAATITATASSAAVDWRLTLWAVAALGVVAAIGISASLPKVVLSATSLTARLAPPSTPTSEQ